MGAEDEKQRRVDMGNILNAARRMIWHENLQCSIIWRVNHDVQGTCRGYYVSKVWRSRLGSVPAVGTVVLGSSRA